MSDNNSNENNNSSESEVTFPLKMLTPQNLQFLLNYIARDLGLVNVGKYKTTINGVWIHKNLDLIRGSIKRYQGYIPNVYNNNTAIQTVSSDSENKVIEFKNKLHAITDGGYHFIGDLYKWELISYPGSIGQLLVFNNKLYKDNSQALYEFNENTRKWILKCTHSVSYSWFIEFDNKLHIFGQSKHKAWDGISSTAEINYNNIPTSSTSVGQPFILDNTIHYIDYNTRKRYRWIQNDDTWEYIETMIGSGPWKIIKFKNEYHYFDRGDNHLVLRNNEWIELNKVSTLANGLVCNTGDVARCIFVYNNKLYNYAYLGVKNPDLGTTLAYISYLVWDEENDEWITNDYDIVYTVENNYYLKKE